MSLGDMPKPSSPPPNISAADETIPALARASFNLAFINSPLFSATPLNTSFKCLPAKSCVLPIILLLNMSWACSVNLILTASGKPVFLTISGIVDFKYSNCWVLISKCFLAVK